MALQREQVVQTAEKYVSRGKIEPAIREYRKLLAENPNDINTLNRIGDLYARIHRIDEAVDFFTQIAERYTAEGFFVKAIAIYKKIIKLDPTRLEVYEKLAELYHKQGLVNEARTQYQVLADYYQKHDNAASAIAIYQKMADLEPNNPTYHVKLAEIYQQQQLVEKAVGEYRVIAEMMITHGRSQDAAQVYERALDIDSGNIGFISDAVFKLKESGNAAAAARFLAIATERNPQAARVGRLARVEEPEVAAEPEPAPAPLVTPPPPPVEEERESTFTGWEDDLAATLRAAAAAVAEPAPAAAKLETEEFDLDLDEVFVLDMEEEEEPASLVKPPPDMVGEGSRPGSAWAGAEERPAPPVAEPAMPPLPMEPELLPEVEIEIDLEPAADLTPASALDSFESVDFPRLEGSGEIFLELEPELPQLDSAPWTIEPAPHEPGPEPAALEIDADLLDRTAAELHPKPAERDEDLVSEAEVLAKYGLEEKALERLREALRINPHNLAAYTQMVQIHLDKGRHGRVVELANAMASAAGEVRDTQEAWPRVRKQLLAAGYRLDGDHVVSGPHALVEEPAPAALEPAAPALEPAPAAPAAKPRRRLSDIEKMILGLLEQKPKRPAPHPAAPTPPPSQTASPAEPAPAVQSAPPPPSAAPATAEPAIFNPLEIGEMIAREEGFEWQPGDMGRSPAPPPAFLAPSSPPAATGDRGLTPGLDDTGGLSWLDEADRDRPARGADAESLFDEEDDFFDLAAELEQELSQEDLFPSGEGLLVQPAEQSLEEIVEGFKKGVAEHLSPTDYDTHFNLGIAYREMGLLDEAIGEFQIAAKDPQHLVLCCSMLGLCFLDKGLPELAVKWYTRGLEAPNLSEDDTLGLLYDLGCAYLAVGDEASAYKAFVDLYGINTNYRDVVARIEELGRP
ncbi:MAG TPA: tetratricopeptide repeat protein [Thermoanaerobaculia bacterium]|jgi:tetratricopeptide (TPR) repeat protein